MDKKEITLSVNRKEYTLTVEQNLTLLALIRDTLGFTGTKEGCGVGECGACTVLMNGMAVNSCMILATQADGAEILTIEGLQGPNGELHPLQATFIEEGAVQCGFCTPGMLMSTYALMLENQNPSAEDIKRSIEGNLCRCTGYLPIVRAVQKVAAESE